MDIAFNVPINSVSFGQTSFNILKAAHAAGHNLSLCHIGEIDLSTVLPDKETLDWIGKAQENYVMRHTRKNRSVKLWHLVTSEFEKNTGKIKKLNPSYDSISDDETFISFYELDSPTTLELNVARNFDTVFTSRYTCEVFAEHNVKTRYAPLAFDKDAFKVLNKQYYKDDRIAFALLGKFENRKHHMKIVQAWTKRFGNDRKYYLQTAIYNPFFPEEMNANLFRGAMGGKHYWNVNYVKFIQTNAMYNDFLNSNHIVIAMSGGEGWGLPEFHTVGLGKHAVVLNAHVYKDWANEKNAVLVNPLSKVPVYDGVFFQEGYPYNQGNIFTFDDEEFIAACEAAIERYKAAPVNTEGLKLQDDFTYEKTLNAILNKD
jgi:hypothetical protein